MPPVSTALLTSTEVVSLDSAALAVIDAWQAHVGVMLDPPAALKLTAAGWGPAQVQHLADLAAQAVAIDPLRAGNPAGGVQHRARRVAKSLGMFARQDLIPAGCSVSETFAWLSLNAGAETSGARQALRDAWSGRRVRPTGRVRGLRAALPPEIAPLAWAAGLCTVEAASGYSSGSLTEDGLRLLGGLRGYRHLSLT